MSGSLVFDGNIDLLAGTWHSDGYKLEAIAGLSFGEAIPVEVALTSFLRDGTVVAHDRDDNRELTVLVKVTASDSLGLNLASKRLSLATRKRSTLVWTPPDGVAPPTVFPVWTSSLGQPDAVFDDFAETFRSERLYQLRLVCEPFSRSLTAIVDDADTPAVAGTVVDACEATTGWSSPLSSTAPAVDSTVFAAGTGSVRCEAYSVYTGVNEYGIEYSSAYNRDVKTLSLSTGSGGYLSVLIRMDWPVRASQPRSEIKKIKQTTAGGPTIEVPFVAAEVLADRWVRYSWPVAASLVVTKLEFEIYQTQNALTTAEPFVRYDSITLSAAATTDQQIVKTFDVEGSARAPGSLHVVAPDDGVALGDVLVVTMPESDAQPGFRPDVRRWLTSGSATTDTTALGGSFYTSTAAVFDVPVSILRAGPHHILAAVKTTGADMTVNAQLYSGSLTGPVSSASATVPTGANEWRIVVLGTVQLPPVPMQNPGAAAKVRITFAGTSVSVAEVFVVPVGGAFTIAACGSGTVGVTAASSHLWIDSPDASQTLGGYWRGPAENRVDARGVGYPDLRQPGRHVFTPGRMKAFVVTTRAQGARVELDYFPHWHDFAAVRRG